MYLVVYLNMCNNNWTKATTPPGNMREVIICFRLRGHKAVALGHYNRYRKEWFIHDNYDPVEVTHWMEKPYPPEESNEQLSETEGEEAEGRVCGAG